MTSGWEKRPTAQRQLSSTARGYGADWRRLRAYVLARDLWVCQVCGIDLRRPGVVATVDHIKPVVEHPELRLDPANCRAACRRCNNKLGAKLGHKRSQAKRASNIRIW